MSTASQNRETRSVRLFLVDDSQDVRQTLKTFLGSQENFDVCGEADHGDDILALLEGLHPDLIIMDLSLEQSDGLSLTRRITSHFKEMRVLMLSIHNESFYAERALRAGASGYLMKDDAAEMLVTAIEEVMNGKVYLSEAVKSTILKRVMQSTPPDDERLISRLSDRELEIFHLIGKGLSAREIAETLGISTKTVETHKSHIEKKRLAC